MILFLLPDADYDPTESAVPWKILTEAGVEVSFATPSGKVGYADERLTKTGFGVLSPFFMTRKRDLAVYQEMKQSEAFNNPSAISDIDINNISGLFVPGGHAPRMKTLLESDAALSLVAAAFERKIPVGAVCHGVLLLARAKDQTTGFSCLHGRKVTALPVWMENFAWFSTKFWLGDYYRTYQDSVEKEVKDNLRETSDYTRGAIFPYRDLHL